MLVFEKLLQMYVLFSYRVASLGPQSITVKPEKIICPRISEPCSLEILEMRNRDLKLQTTIECKILSVSMVRHKSGFFLYPSMKNVENFTYEGCGTECPAWFWFSSWDCGSLMELFRAFWLSTGSLACLLAFGWETCVLPSEQIALQSLALWVDC